MADGSFTSRAISEIMQVFLDAELAESMLARNNSGRMYEIIVAKRACDPYFSLLPTIFILFLFCCLLLWVRNGRSCLMVAVGSALSERICHF